MELRDFFTRLKWFPPLIDTHTRTARHSGNTFHVRFRMYAVIAAVTSTCVCLRARLRVHYTVKLYRVIIYLHLFGTH